MSRDRGRGRGAGHEQGKGPRQGPGKSQGQRQDHGHGQRHVIMYRDMDRKICKGKRIMIKEMSIRGW